MKAIGSLLVTISLIIGTIAATTSYLVPIDRIDPETDRVVLHAPAGATIDDDDPTALPRPILQPGTTEEPLVLEKHHLQTLREAEATRVHAKQFSLRHWRESWLFALACIGLLTGSLMVRTATKRELASTAQTTDRQTATPEQLLDGALTKAKDLQRELASMSDRGAKLHRVMRRIEVLQDDHFEPFVFGRATIINKLGMGGYAQVMDRFAASERQFNRAWSAAADDMYDEAVECLGEAIARLEEAIHQLKALAAREPGQFDQPIAPEQTPEHAQVEPGEPPRGHNHDRPLT